jgi:hypothetical protein
VFRAGPYRAFGEQFTAVSKRDLDGSFNRIRSANPGPLPSNRLKIVAASGFFHACLMTKRTKAFAARQARAERSDALLAGLAARLLEIDMSERLAAIGLTI